MESANLSQQMIDCFGIHDLVFADPKIVEALHLERSVDNFFKKVGLPYVFDHFRFFMNLTPIIKDPKLSRVSNNLDLEGMYTFGTQVFSPFLGINFYDEKLHVRGHHVEDIGLTRNASLEQIRAKIEPLAKDDSNRLNFENEVRYVCRMCLDTRNNNRIVLIDPHNSEIFLVNSSIQQLALFLIYLSQLSLRDFIDTAKLVDTVAMENNTWWDIYVKKLVHERYMYSDLEVIECYY